MNEIVINFGERGLLGVLSLPEQPDPRRPAVVIPNTGIEHRVGPGRLHVRLARGLARRGYTSLRLDLSGMGDSPSDVQGDAIRDLQQAMDELQRLGYGGRFAAVGLCSGAQDVHRLALADSRVTALACLDGYAYRTPRFVLTYLQQRLSDGERLMRFLKRPLYRRSPPRMDTGQIDYFRKPSREQMRRELAELRRRGVALCYVYSGQMQYIYNYASQLTDAFPQLKSHPAFELHHMVQADHTFSTGAMSDDLTDRLLGWLERAQQQVAGADAELPLPAGVVVA